jgi:hypothetical protein
MNVRKRVMPREGSRVQTRKHPVITGRFGPDQQRFYVDVNKGVPTR